MLSLALAGSPPETALSRVKVCSPTILFAGTDTLPPWPSGMYGCALFALDPKLPESAAGPGPATIQCVPHSVDPTYLRVELAGEGLIAPTDYLLVVTSPAGVRVGHIGFSTAPAASLRRSPAELERPTVFELNSTVEFRSPGECLGIVEVLQEAISGRQADGRPQAIPEVMGRALPLAVQFQPQSGDCAAADPDAIGNLKLELPVRNRPTGDAVKVRLTGVKNVFGDDVKAEAELVKGTPPKGKDDAQYYLKLGLDSSLEGNADAFSLDVKLKPTLLITPKHMVHPELTASISKNVPKSTNSVRFALLLSQSFLREPGRRADAARPVSQGPANGANLATQTPKEYVRLVSQTFEYGPAAEADRQLDRVNLILDLRWRPQFSGLYRSREFQQLQLAIRSSVDVKKVPMPPIGWGIEFLLGLEAGSSLKDQTLKNDEGATLEIDGYEVLRGRPHVHAFFEFRSLTFDVTSSLRYLAATEEIGRKTDAGALELHHVHGFEPFTEATLSLAFDPLKHTVLAITYKNGGEPPDFERVEKLSAGIVLKY